jgi:hypothetical protein
MAARLAVRDLWVFDRVTTGRFLARGRGEGVDLGADCRGERLVRWDGGEVRPMAR